MRLTGKLSQIAIATFIIPVVRTISSWFDRSSRTHITVCTLTRHTDTILRTISRRCRLKARPAHCRVLSFRENGFNELYLRHKRPVAMARTYRSDSSISTSAGAFAVWRHFRRYLGEQLPDSAPVSYKRYCPPAARQIVFYAQGDQLLGKPAQLFALGQRCDDAPVCDERNRKVRQHRYTM